MRLKLLKAITALATGTAPIGLSNDPAPVGSPADLGERRKSGCCLGIWSVRLRCPRAWMRRIARGHFRLPEMRGRACAAPRQESSAGYFGDGVLVYFGYPEAHEDDPERAVRAGLELIAAVSAIPSPVLLETRVGIAYPSRCGRRAHRNGRGATTRHRRRDAKSRGASTGDRRAEHGGYRRRYAKTLGNLFELQDLGAKELKGVTGPVRAWAALRASAVEGRFEALHAAELTALVGRDEEADLLLRRWSRAKTGEGQVVLLSGEAGIGKSRLTAALLERLATEPHTRLRYFCSPQHTDSAFFPIIGQMERAAGLAYDDTAQAKLDKLDAVLARAAVSKQGAALFADMLSLPNDGRYPMLDLAPQQRRQRTLQALILQLQTLSRARPALMIFEDVHWIDPTSLEALSRAVESIASLRVLLIVTHRPEFEPPWIGRPHVTALTINRLAHRDISAMIDRVVGNKLLAASVRHDIIERTDGIPLFVEEMTKAVLEAENEGDARRTAAGVPSSAMAVPATLHASLMARLDRLGPAKELAQVGAVIGREFSHALLAAVARKPEADVNSALDRLIAAGLLFRQGVPPDASYLFKHALVQDAAYGTLLREPRRALHGRIAEVLERQFGDIAESQPELLARHCTEAGLVEKAAGFWGKAGQRALARSALKEAAEQLAHALRQVAALPGTAALRRQRIILQINLANALIHTKGHASPETKASFEQARLLIEEAEALGEPPRRSADALRGPVRVLGCKPHGVQRRCSARACSEIPGTCPAPAPDGPLMIGHLLKGISLAWWEILPKGARRSIARSRCTIPRSTVHWRRASDTTSARRHSPGGPWPRGCSVTPRPRSPTPRTRSATPERSGMQRRRCLLSRIRRWR